MISLIIPIVKSSIYSDNIVKNIRELYPDESKVEIILEENPNCSLGTNYNNAVNRASGDKIILLHDDMVISKGFIETMDKHIQKNRITTYTRIEPPIYNDTYPGKVIMDMGRDVNSFNESSFNSLQFTESLVDGGSQLFFGCLKEDYIGIDGNTFKKFCEDDDLHLRYKLLGFEKKVSSAYVYHFVSKTSRVGDYTPIEMASNKNFIRKWGFRNSKHNKKYDIGFIVKNCNLNVLNALEVWCSNLYIVDKNAESIVKKFISDEQSVSSIDLTKKVLLGNIGSNDILVEFDANKLNQESFNIIQNLSDIIFESGEVGEFQLDIFNITIKSIKSYEFLNHLVHVKV